ncbi:DUF4838 domain-containing protein [Lignipirellula cremea]|uniref:Carbohydrate-binding domain-containing protein n=1 Tax=Lignipirellula cremea TaxID=2528010 RepID=A0A518DLJ1_9BACT|nr:DUF4838 domain-containing protein [Lignipirellula cremea]QDU92709.1 hypothetical protein Pla8534_04570 [Lignipirellula cremea]
MKTPLILCSYLLLLGVLPALADDAFLVKDGQPQAEIIIAQDPPRTVRLAAAELQNTLEKISGAKLPIATAPHDDIPVKVYVGDSPHARKEQVTAAGLKDGAWRMVSGPNWLALIGDDTNFTPREPWAKNNGGIASGQLQRDWEEAAGGPWGVPNRGMYKHRVRLPGDIGKPTGAETDNKETLELWGFDERGSYNAVCGFLRSLGVRWYLPGELGEVVPQMASIRLPTVDQTVQPDFAVRRFNVRFANASPDTMQWAMRLGMRDPYGLMVAHGMHAMTQTDTILRDHPDWFALYGGQRDNQPGKRLNHLCYSNEELLAETVRYARAQFDQYDFDTVSIMPPDAYISICQCPLCAGKESPQRGSRGKLSNHVWDFVNRVAKEVGKTHPDKKIVCCAYGANTLPPTNIEQLEPNVQVLIVGGRRPRSNLPEQRAETAQLRADWAAKTQNKLMIFENYPFTDRGFYLPAFVARSIGDSINATKGVSDGEDIWLSFGRDFDTKDIGFNHFQVYFTARMYWGGKDQDPVALLEEYCRLFYGPAGEPMQAFFTYCEDHWQAMEKEKDKVDHALALFSTAQSQVAVDSVYAKRLALIDEFLNALRSKAEQLGRQRGPVPKLRLVRDAEEIVIDGKLDDDYWQNCPASSTGVLRELQTGRQPLYGTSVKCGWSRAGDLYFAFRCDENPGERPNIATVKPGDQALWYGDAIEILLETDSHSYYQIAVNPAGVVVDLDRGVAKSNWFEWDSQAEVATHVADDHWTVEVRIPVTDDENDPLHQVVGRQPSTSLPWHINLCRQRIRGNVTEHSAYSPTGKPAFHEPMKFAHLHSGRSHAFDHDEPDDDYLHGRSTADGLFRSGQREEAMAAFAALAQRKEFSDFQKCDALEQAAACARALRDFDRANELAAAAPLESVQKSIRMQNLLAERKAAELLEAFGKEDLSTWPFWNAGEGYFARGRAHLVMKNGAEAAADLQAALPRLAPGLSRLGALWMLGQTQEQLLQNDAAALAAYQQVTQAQRYQGSADFYYGVLGAARVQTRQGKFEDALATLHLADIDKVKGTWRHRLLESVAQTQTAAGRPAEAIAAWQQIQSDESAAPAQRTSAEQAIQALRKP